MKTYVYCGKSYQTLTEAQDLMTLEIENINNGSIQNYININAIERKENNAMLIHPERLGRAFLENGEEYIIHFPLDGATHVSKDIDVIDALIETAKEQHIRNGGFGIIYEFDESDSDSAEIEKTLTGYYDHTGKYAAIIQPTNDTEVVNQIDEFINSLETS